ncbi:DUF3035 domain-containing protein [Geminicoccus harenae]|uniref:DUF3035 domain-containing protein n=3 Tax=Geminicoccus harenae TaxID=2498453 RepID=UPI001C948B20|nr:DUF3035 domain-containing protein [Geminicoccus harenae]
MRSLGTGLPRLSAGLALLLLAGCGETTVQEQLGLVRSGPDEFQVVRQAPLEMPPSMAELPPPRPGAPPISQADPSRQARNVLLGAATTAPVATAALDPAAAPASAPVDRTSPGQQALLAATGEAGADPDIRQVLAQEGVESTSISDRTFLFIAFWQKPDPEDQPGVVLDPVAESQRLQEAGINAAERPLTMRVGSVPLAAPPIN